MAGAKLLGALAPFEKQAFEQARRHDRRERPDAYRADALEAMCDAVLAGGTGRGSDATATAPRTRKPAFVAVIDAKALKRGHAEPGERCEITGVGEVSVAALMDHAPDAVWHAVVSDGIDVLAYASMKRHIPDWLKLCLAVRDPECVVPGCNQTHSLEYDHVTPYAHGGPTAAHNLAPLCPHDHAQENPRPLHPHPRPQRPMALAPTPQPSARHQLSEGRAAPETSKRSTCWKHGVHPGLVPSPHDLDLRGAPVVARPSRRARPRGESVGAVAATSSASTSSSAAAVRPSTSWSSSCPRPIFVELMVAEMRQVDGVDVEDDHGGGRLVHDPRLDALETAAVLVGAPAGANAGRAVRARGAHDRRRVVGGGRPGWPIGAGAAGRTAPGAVVGRLRDGSQSSARVAGRRRRPGRRGLGALAPAPAWRWCSDGTARPSGPGNGDRRPLSPESSTPGFAS